MRVLLNQKSLSRLLRVVRRDINRAACDRVLDILFFNKNSRAGETYLSEYPALSDLFNKDGVFMTIRTVGSNMAEEHMQQAQKLLLERLGVEDDFEVYQAE